MGIAPGTVRVIVHDTRGATGSGEEPRHDIAGIVAAQTDADKDGIQIVRLKPQLTAPPGLRRSIQTASGRPIRPRKTAAASKGPIARCWRAA